MGTSSAKPKQQRVFSGYLKEDINKYITQGNTLSIGNMGLAAPEQKFISAAEQNSLANPEDIKKMQTLSDLFQARIELLQQKSARPGLLLTRGEK